jgi:1-deoxy-D-xylulose-5-phosphate synthase
MQKIAIGKATCIKEGKAIAILSIGTIGNAIIDLQSELSHLKISHYNMRFVKPLDESLLHRIFKKYNTIVTIEDGTLIGGFGSAILEFASNNKYTNKRIEHLGIPDNFIEHGKVEELFENIHLSKKKILDFLLSL